MIIFNFLIMIITISMATSMSVTVTHLVDDRTLNVTVMVQTWSASLVSDKCQYESV